MPGPGREHVPFQPLGVAMHHGEIDLETAQALQLLSASIDQFATMSASPPSNVLRSALVTRRVIRSYE